VVDILNQGSGKKGAHGACIANLNFPIAFPELPKTGSEKKGKQQDKIASMGCSYALLRGLVELAKAKMREVNTASELRHPYPSKTSIRAFETNDRWGVRGRERKKIIKFTPKRKPLRGPALLGLEGNLSQC